MNALLTNFHRFYDKFIKLFLLCFIFSYLHTAMFTVQCVYVAVFYFQLSAYSYVYCTVCLRCHVLFFSHLHTAMFTVQCVYVAMFYFSVICIQLCLLYSVFTLPCFIFQSSAYSYVYCTVCLRCHVLFFSHLHTAMFTVQCVYVAMFYFSVICIQLCLLYSVFTFSSSRLFHFSRSDTVALMFCCTHKSLTLGKSYSLHSNMLHDKIRG
jgi:hypothetical protein